SVGDELMKDRQSYRHLYFPRSTGTLSFSSGSKRKSLTACVFVSNLSILHALPNSSMMTSVTILRNGFRRNFNPSTFHNTIFMTSLSGVFIPSHGSCSFRNCRDRSGRPFTVVAARWRPLSGCAALSLVGFEAACRWRLLLVACVSQFQNIHGLAPSSRCSVTPAIFFNSIEKNHPHPINYPKLNNLVSNLALSKEKGELLSRHPILISMKRHYRLRAVSSHELENIVNDPNFQSSNLELDPSGASAFGGELLLHPSVGAPMNLRIKSKSPGISNARKQKLANKEMVELQLASKAIRRSSSIMKECRQEIIRKPKFVVEDLSQMSQRATGNKDMAKVLKDLIKSTTRATKFRKAVVAGSRCTTKKHSPEEALAIFLEANLSMNQYEDRIYERIRPLKNLAAYLAALSKMSDLEHFDHVFGIRREEEFDRVYQRIQLEEQENRRNTKITEVVLSLRSL
ncbi:hypothetical protein L9F63_000565, partial [Diploptera punctata]